MVAKLIPPPRNGRQQITRDLRCEIVKEYSRIRVVQSEEEADHQELSIDRDARTVSLFGEPFPLESDPIAARRDAKFLVEFSATTRAPFRAGWEWRGSRETTSFSGPGSTSRRSCAIWGR